MGDKSKIEEILGNYINMNLQEIAIPKNVKNIGVGAFMMCMDLENVVFEENSDLTNIGMYSFMGCSSLKTINLEATKLEEIGAVAFASMDELMPMLIEEITFPSTLKTIGEMAFGGCSSLSKINIQIESIESYLEWGEIPLGYYMLATSFSKAKVSLYENGEHITRLELPDTITEISPYAFAGLDITSVSIPESVTTIGQSAFAYCTNLVSVVIPENVTTIGQSAFSNCTKLASIVIPESVTTIGQDAFSGCYRLVVYCEVKSKPSGWSSNMLPLPFSPIHFGLNVTWEYDEVTGEPKLI